MSIQSIFRNINIETTEQAQEFIEALEKAERAAQLRPFKEVEKRDLTDDEYNGFYGVEDHEQAHRN